MNEGTAEFSKIRAVCFDLDDTLCGYWDASKAAIRKAFEMHTPDAVSVDEMVAAWARAFRDFSRHVKRSDWYGTYLQRGEPTRTELMRLALLEVGFDDVDRAKRMSQIYAQERNERLRLFPDAREVLDTLKQRFPLGLITNGPADIQRQEIQTLGLVNDFALVLIEGELGFGKPEHQVFEKAEHFFDLKPEELLFIGNSYAHDIRPALERGWRAIWVRRHSDVPPSSGRNGEVESRPIGSPVPDAEIEDLKSLLTLLA